MAAGLGPVLVLLGGAVQAAGAAAVDLEMTLISYTDSECKGENIKMTTVFSGLTVPDSPSPNGAGAVCQTSYTTTSDNRDGSQPQIRHHPDAHDVAARNLGVKYWCDKSYNLHGRDYFDDSCNEPKSSEHVRQEFAQGIQEAHPDWDARVVMNPLEPVVYDSFKCVHFATIKAQGSTGPVTVNEYIKVEHNCFSVLPAPKGTWIVMFFLCCCPVASCAGCIVCIKRSKKQRNQPLMAVPQPHNGVVQVTETYMSPVVMGSWQQQQQQQQQPCRNCGVMGAGAGFCTGCGAPLS